MKFPIRVMVTLLLALPIVPAAQGDAKKELASLQGTWVVLSLGGKPAPPGFHAALVFSGDKYQGLENGKVNETGTIKLDPSRKPMSIDLLLDTGSSAGKTQLGLAEVAGDTLTLTLANPGAARLDASNTEDRLVLTKLKPIAKEFEGSWEGTLDAGGRVLRAVFTLTNGADGLATGTFRSVDQSNTDVPIAAVIQTGARIKLVMPVVRGAYEGELKDGQLTGTWAQGAGSLPLVLKRKG